MMPGRRKQYGGALAEFSVVIIFLLILLQWLLDSGQKVTANSWFANVAYQASYAGLMSNRTDSERSYRQYGVLKLLTDVTNQTWSMNRIDTDPSKLTIHRQWVNGDGTPQATPSGKFQTEIRGEMKSLWRSTPYTITVRFAGRELNPLSSIQSEGQIFGESLRTAEVDCCGRVIESGSGVSASNTSCYAANGTLIASC